MRFAEPYALFALVLVPLVVLIHLWLMRRHRRLIERAGDPALLGRLSEPGQAIGQRIRWAQVILQAFVLTLVTVAVARPQFGLRTEIRKARGMDVIVALDLSRSMLAQDVVPSRLDRARIEISDLVDRLHGDRVGLIGFTSIALPLCPLTIDHAALKLQLKAAMPDDLPRGGTAIGDAIRAGMEALESSKTSAAKAIVVVTDGEEHEGDPEKAAQEAQEAGIEVHVVGVGSRTGEPIPLLDKDGQMKGYLKDKRGQTVVSRLNEEMLQGIATAGGGLTALPGPQGGLDLTPVRNHLATLQKAELDDRTIRVYEERYPWFLTPAFVLLLIASFMRPTRRTSRHRLTGRLSGTALFLWLASHATAAFADGPLEAEDPNAQAGRQALQEGRGEDAIKAFEKAMDRLGETPELAFNLGLAEAARGELDAAASRFRQAMNTAGNANLRGRAAYALGNVHRQLKKYDDAVTAYRRALTEDPRITGARRNLELATAMKAIQAAQPKDPNQDGEPDPDQKPPEQDGGVSDGGHQDGGGSDGGPPDAGSGDGGGQGQDGGGEQDPADAGTGTDDDGGGSGEQPDSGGANSGDASPQDAGGASSNPEPNEAPEEERNAQETEDILDALQEQEKALKRKQLMKKLKGRRVEKDW